MEQNSRDKFIFATFCSVVFVIALLYATLEIFSTLNHMLLTHFPELTDPMKIEEFMYYARPIGYVSLVIVAALVILGFVVEKEKLSFLGSIALYLPTFGYFVVSMFFFAGIGVLRVLWLPLWDLSPRLMRLGDIVFLPYMLVAFLCQALGFHLLDLMRFRSYFSLFFIGVGFFFFFLATETWLYGKVQGRKVIDFWIYKYLRHPLYLGFLLWSYGFMVGFLPYRFPYLPAAAFKWQAAGGLTWLFSTLVTVFTALREEAEMDEKYGKNYTQYKAQTPFMVPLPKHLSTLLTTPVRLLFGKNLPDSKKEIACMFFVYVGILMILSLPFFFSYYPPGSEWFAPSQLIKSRSGRSMNSAFS